MYTVPYIGEFIIRAFLVLLTDGIWIKGPCFLYECFLIICRNSFSFAEFYTELTCKYARQKMNYDSKYRSHNHLSNYLLDILRRVAEW